MYALVDNQQLILGPISFNYRMFNDELEELELDFRVNSSSYLNVPITITESIKILPARYEDPSYDPRFEYLTNVSYQVINDEVIFAHDKVEKSLEQIKEERKATVSEERKKLENTVIDITLNGEVISVSTSKENRLSYIAKLASTNSTETYNFKFANDTWKQISSTDLNYVVNKIDQKVQEAFDWELSKKEEIDNCQTKEEVYLVEVNTPQLG